MDATRNADELETRRGMKRILFVQRDNNEEMCASRVDLELLHMHTHTRMCS